MTSKHTPTPWRITKRRSRKIVSTGGISIASVVLKNTGNVNAKTNQKSESEAQANADFIITAVNAYEDNQATIKRLQSLDKEYGRVEAAIIMSDLTFDGDSDHDNCGDRLIASVHSMRDQVKSNQVTIKSLINTLKDLEQCLRPNPLHNPKWAYQHICEALKKAGAE